jgi:superfamily II DNA or RNA helicase
MMQQSLFAEQLYPQPAWDRGGSLSLRPYQRECLTAIREAADKGVQRQLVSLATGMGKTVIFAHLPPVLELRRMLVLAHRKELLTQAQRKLRQANPGMSVEIEQADRYALHDADIVVASVQTLGRKGSQRNDKFAPDAFDCVVIDEAHHATADSYVNILRYFRTGEHDGPLLVGVTATPFRGDGTPLANLFDQVTYEKSLREGIDENWLCRIRAQRVRSQADLSNVATRCGDFADTQLAAAMNTDYRNSLVASAIEQHAVGRNSILVFGVDIAHVETLTKQLQDRGHRAECVTSWTPEDERWRIFGRFESGETRIFVNCGIATEGYDCPPVDCIVMARPTKSALLYTQMLGRGTRQSPDTGKQDLLVIDVVDVCGKHRIQTAATAFGLRELDLLGGDVLDAVKVCEKAARHGVTVQDGDSIQQVEQKVEAQVLLAKATCRVNTLAEAIDVFATIEPCEEVEAESIFPWIRQGEGYILPIDRNLRAVLARDALGTWGCDVTGVGGMNCGDGEAPPFREADRVVKRFAGTFVKSDGTELPSWRVIAMDASWRRREPTEGQKQQLRRMGIRVLPPDLTRGAAG